MSTDKMNFIDEGVKDYGMMLAKQRDIFSSLVDKKKHGLPVDEEYIFLVEHNPVVTLGKHAKINNLLFSEEMIRQRGVDVYHIERGGDVTYHGPGQLVVYPILDLERHHLGVKDYVHLLEEVVIKVIGDFDVKGERVEGASGVWIDVGTPFERKICALGVKCSRFITMHGFALNVNTDLSGFSLINPCGFTDKGVTSLARELTHPCDMQAVKQRVIHHFTNLL